MTNFDEIQNILGIKFNDTKLLELALTHRSFLNESKQARQSNERLEFLGDSVLSVLVSTELFNRFPDFPEGKLTNLRSFLVKAPTLGEVAKKLHYGQFLQMSRGEEQGGGRENMSLLADTFEAVLGAIYLDQNLEVANKFLERVLFPLISQVEKKEDLLDYKSTLQEITQEKEKLSPVYKVTGESGPDHNKYFTVGVFLNGLLLGEGTGKSKQIAQQQAAKAALEKYPSIR